jgi:hypothetical protein
MQVLYDPVRSEQLHHVYQDGRVTMQFVGKAAGTEVDFLFDSGTSTNYVSSASAKMHGLTVKPSGINVRLGTETSVSAQGECSDGAYQAGRLSRQSGMLCPWYGNGFPDDTWRHVAKYGKGYLRLWQQEVHHSKE